MPVKIRKKFYITSYTNHIWNNILVLFSISTIKMRRIQTGWQSPTSIHALIWEWIHKVDLSFIVLKRKASKSRNTSLCRSRYLAGWWGIIVAKSRFLHLHKKKKNLYIGSLRWKASMSISFLQKCFPTYF